MNTETGAIRLQWVKFACAGMLILATGSVAAAQRWHGVSVFGPEGLKYKRGEGFDYLNPDAPIAGRLRMACGSFTKLTPFGLMGTVAPSLEMHCFEALGIKSWDDDEAYSVYGLIAESFEIADDKRSITVRLRPEARFSDGKPVTADDVIFSYDLLYDPDINPALRLTWKPVERMVKLDKHTVRADFKQFSRDLPVRVAGLVIYPKHVYGAPGVNLAEDFIDTPPVGSGPYRVESFAMGERISYARRDDYWGQDIPYCKGYLNWKVIEYQAYYDTFSQQEALKSGLLDFKCWFQPDVLHKLEGDGYRKGYLKRAFFPITRPAAMKCMIFNLRRPLFQDVEMRKVLISLYDFEFLNRNFFYGDEERIVSYFNNQPQLRAAAGPATGRVREVLTALAKKHNRADMVYVPDEALERGPYELGTDAAGKRLPIEAVVHAACLRLDKMGWHWNKEQNVRMKNGRKLKLEIMMDGPEVFHFTEICRLAGIDAQMAKLSPLEQQSRRRNCMFDCAGGWFDGRKAPGRELARNFMSSEADIKGSANTMGLQNPAIDEVLDVLSAAEDRVTVETYAKVFDRIMCSNWYVLPRSWVLRDHAVHWTYLRQPEQYASGLWALYNIWWYWWFDEDRYQAIQDAQTKGVAVEFGTEH